MNKSIISKAIIRNVYICLAFIASISIPYFERLSTFLFIIWGILGLLTVNLANCTYFRNQILLFMLPFLYVLNIIALVYTSNIDHGLFILEKKAALFFVPPLLFFTQDTLQPYFRKISNVFVFSVIISSGICLIIALFRSLSFTSEGLQFNAAVVEKGKGFLEANQYGGNYFFHSYISFFKHPSYFALYICFSIAYVFDITVLHAHSFIKRILLIFTIVYLFGFLLLLAVRISLVFLVIFFLWKYCRYFKKMTKTARLLSLLAFVFFVILNLNYNYRVKNIISDGFQIIRQDRDEISSNSAKRLMIWKIALDKFNVGGIVGAGPGDVQDALNRQYKKKGILTEFEGLNAHNQFIQTYLGLGFMGLLILLTHFYPLIKIKTRQNRFLINFLLVCFLFFMMESILEKHDGIVFYSYIYSVLFIENRRIEKENYVQ